VTKLGSTADLEKLRKQILSKRDPKKSCIIICSGTGCKASGCDRVSVAFREELEKQNLVEKVDVRTTGCPGFCERGPIVVIQPEGIFYQLVEAKDVGEIVSETVLNKRIIDRLLYNDPQTGHKIVLEKEVPFYKRQKRILMDSNSLIDPVKIEDYLAIGGYSALVKVLFEMKPEQVIDTIKQSGLRGRGGAGFPTGVKWESCRRADGDMKYVIVNADEGDPGAFANRGLLEGNPHSVLEGLIIGAYAIGSHEGFVYVRQEYPLAVENTEIAIRQLEEYGLLGKNILGSEFDFKVTIHRGAGAFVSGESSALMTAIEGKVGEPQPKYIHTVVKGIWGRPSCLNNVETWATVPAIINNGVDWFNSIGTKGSKGTKIFSLVGKVNNTGLVEVPMGMTLREIIYEIGGGIPNGKKFKAVQTGGPSGGCIPEKYLNLPVDFDELAKAGSMMGSGGMIIMDEDTCMVDTAKYFANFLADESCGKCIPCREGLYQMLQILNRICEGEGKEGDIDLLEEIAEMVRDFSLCQLGATASNPVLSTIKYFREEYEAHIKTKRCPAFTCKKLVSYYIDPKKCQACLICQKNCPVEAISGGKRLVHIVDQVKCTKCGTCFEVCPARFSAVTRLSGEGVPKSVPAGTEIVRRGGG